MDRCIFCFKEISQDICPCCGKKQSSYEQSEYKLAPGTVIAERYIIGAVIGEGGFGITYLAYDKKLESRCAVKEYFPHELSVRNSAISNTVSIADNGGEYSAGLVRFRNEAERLSKFYSIKSIVSVKDYIEENNTGYIIMNYVEGISLKEYLDTHNGKIEAGQFFSMIEPIIHALSNVQKDGIIHRDISPENIMVTEENRLVLIDFGSAREYEDNKSLSIILKHGYAPPEQYISTGKQGPWTDVYSLCATIYRAITGKAPDDSIDLMESGSKTKKPSKLGAKLSDKRETALMKGLELNYKERIQSCEELYSKFYIEDDGKIRTSSKKAFAAGAASVAVLAVACAAVFFAVQRDNNGDSIAVPAESVSSETDSTTVTTTESITVTTTEAVTETEVTVDENILASGNTENGEWVLTRDGVLTINASGPVGSSSGGWTEYSDKITEVVLGDEVTELNKEAFKNHINLATVQFNDNLKKIGDSSFLGCTSLESADIPESVAYIGKKAFEASGITSLCINGAPELKARAFSNCVNLSQASLGNAVWDEGSMALFSGCESLKSIVIPEGIYSIALLQFENCKALESVTFPNTLINIESQAFSNCVSLTEISLPEKMNKIYKLAFENCVELETVNMPIEIEELTLTAFYGCTKYVDMELPQTVGTLDLNRWNYESDGPYSVNFPDNFTCKDISEYGKAKSYNGSGGIPILIKMFEDGYDVKFTDDLYKTKINYILGNIFYVNKLYDIESYFSDDDCVSCYNVSVDGKYKYYKSFANSEDFVKYIVISDDVQYENGISHAISLSNPFPRLKGIYIPPNCKIDLDSDLYNFGFYDKEYIVYTKESEYDYIPELVKFVRKNIANNYNNISLNYIQSYDEMIKQMKGE